MSSYPVGPARAYTTIQAAIDASAADPDPHVPIDGGTYNEVLDLKKAAGGRVVPVFLYAADPNNKPILSGAGLSAGQAVLANSAIAIGATERPRFVNLVFDGWNTTNVSYLVYTASTGPSIRAYYCTFQSSDAPVFQNLRGPSGPDQTVIYGCRFVDTGQPIHAENGTYGLVARCYFKPLPDKLCVHNDRTGWYVYNNSAYVNNSGSYGVFRGQDIKNNVIHAHTNNPWYAYNCTGTYDYNRLYGTTGANAGTNGGHNTSGADPLFVSPSTGNLDIQVGSPCIDAGTTLTDAAIDIYGVTAPSGAAYDQGAHELVATTTVTSITVLGSTSIQLNLAASMASDSSWATAGNFVVTGSGGAAAVTVSGAAASGNPGTSITLTLTEHTNGGSYDVAWSGLTNITSGNSGYTGQGTAPTLTSATFTGASTLRVTWAESMTNDSALTTASNYTLTPLSGTPFNPTAVTRISATVVDLTVNQSLTKATGTLSVSGPKDLALNTASGATAALSAWTATIASVVARYASSTYYVRVNLSAAVYRDAATWVGGNVAITGPTAPAATYSAVDAAPASWVDFTTAEHVNGGSYTASLAGLVGITDGSSGFTGVGAAPTIASITIASPTEVHVHFSEDMANNAALTTPSNYSLARSGGSATVSAVVRASATEVVLTTSTLWAGYAYTVTASNITDLVGNAVSGTGSMTLAEAALVSVTHPSTTQLVLVFGPAALHSSRVDISNYGITLESPLLTGAVPAVLSAAQAQTSTTLEVTLTLTAHMYPQNYHVAWSGLSFLADGGQDYVGIGSGQTIAITGRFFPPTVRVFSAAAGSVRSRMSLTGWSELTVTRLDDQSLQALLPLGASGAAIDLLIDAGAPGAPLRAVKRRAYVYP